MDSIICSRAAALLQNMTSLEHTVLSARLEMTINAAFSRHMAKPQAEISIQGRRTVGMCSADCLDLLQTQPVKIYSPATHLNCEHWLTILGCFWACGMKAKRPAFRRKQAHHPGAKTHLVCKAGMIDVPDRLICQAGDVRLEPR